MNLKRQTTPEVKTSRATVRPPADGRPRYPAAARARIHDAEYFRALIESAADGVAVVQPDGAVHYHNPALAALLGYASREVYATNWFDLIHPHDLAAVRAAFQDVQAAADATLLLQFQMKHRNRRWRIVQCSLTNLLKNESVRGLVLSLTDVTERIQAEREVNENRVQLRSLATALTMAEEKERRALATQLHDSVGQTLALANMKLGELLATAAPGEPTDRINELRALMRDMITTTRSLTFHLSPPILYSVGFEAAVEWLGKRTRDEHGIGFSLHTFAPPRPLGEDLRVLLFLIVRELVFNIVKHARARHITISISGGADNLTVVIEDDGVGFDTAILNRRRGQAEGFGLFSIHERLNHVGGTFTVHSAEGQGTTVSLSVPLEARAPNREIEGA